MSLWKNAEAGEGVSVGPYTEIRLPLEDLEEPHPDLTYHPVIDQYPSGASLQVLHVLEDPREVPLARFAYYSQANGGVMAPTNFPTEDWIDGLDNTSYTKELQRLKSENPKAINIYVTAKAPDREAVPDPVFSNYYNDELFEVTFKDTWHSGGRPSLYIDRRRGTYEAGNEKAYEFGAFHCAVPEYADGTQPYELPDEIGGGQAVGDDGLYDPKAYAPPRPWYYSDRPMLQPGETREGWITCLAPDVPLNEIQIRTWFEQKVEPEPTPTMGPTPTSLGPGYTLEECKEAEDCAVVDDLSSEECQEMICMVPSELPTPPPAPTPSPGQRAATVVVEEEDDVSIVDKIAWDYIQARDLPSGGITLEDVPLRFSLWEGGAEIDKKILRGTVTFHSADVVKVDKRTDDVLFISRVQVENVDLSQEESQAFRLSGIGAHVEAYNSPTDPYRNVSFGQGSDTLYSPSLYSINPGMSNRDWLAVNEWSHTNPNTEYLFEHLADSPYVGYVFANLENTNSDLIGYARFAGGDEALPPSVWFRIITAEQEADNPRFLYLAQGHTVSQEFQADTDMCDIVECIEVQKSSGEQKTRKVPLLCPGEWANNITIDGMRIENVDYFGEPQGIRETPKRWVDFSAYGQREEVWFYKGVIMGGLTPWWSDNNYRLTGRIVDPITGEYAGSKLIFLPYYHQSDGHYYAPLNTAQQKSGWIPDIVNEKMLIAGQNFDDKHTVNNTVFLFKEEGPAWKNSCSRPAKEDLSFSSSYAPPDFDYAIEEGQHLLVDILPGADYPLSQPAITGEVFDMNEVGNKIYGQSFKPIEVRIIPGKKNKPVIYVPEEDKYYPANNVTWYNERFFHNVGAVGIPPSSSLVMVKIRKDPSGGAISCKFSNANFQLLYPNRYPITSLPLPGKVRVWGQTPPICPDPGPDVSGTWLTFKFPSLNPDPTKLKLSIRGKDRWDIWNLAATTQSEQ